MDSCADERGLIWCNICAGYSTSRLGDKLHPSLQLQLPTGEGDIPGANVDSLLEPARHEEYLRNFEVISCSVTVAWKVKVFQHFHNHPVQLWQQIQLVQRHSRNGLHRVCSDSVLLEEGRLTFASSFFASISSLFPSPSTLVDDTNARATS